MKKPYEKPAILFESFALSTSIAGNCGKIISNPRSNECGYPLDRFGTIFLEQMSGCTHWVPDNNDSVCYHVPIDDNILFNS